MVKLFQNGYPQQVIAHRLKKSQSYVSKHLARLLERLDREELDDGSRTYSDIDFEILWKKFALTHKTDDFGDVILETFHYLLGAQAWEEFLIWFFSFTEYYRFALKVLFTLDDCPWDDARGHINDLPYRYRLIFAGGWKMRRTSLRGCTTLLYRKFYTGSGASPSPNNRRMQT